MNEKLRSRPPITFAEAQGFQNVELGSDRAALRAGKTADPAYPAGLEKLWANS